MPPARRQPPPIEFPLQYSRSYYRATWIVTGLDAGLSSVSVFILPVSSLVTGFATAMNIKPKWLRDLCSVLFSLYYIFYANEADEKVLSILLTFAILMS